MNIIEQHIRETENIIEGNNSVQAEKLYKKLLGIYGKQIKDFESGTTVLRAKENMVWNLNDGINLSTECDYIEDLKLIIEKLKLFDQQNSTGSTIVNCRNNINTQGNVTITDNSTTIDNSQINEVNLNSKKCKKVSFWKLFAGIIGVLAGIATIVTLILSLCGVIK